MREMKDSGVQWIGEIPVNWECNKTKYSFTCYKDIVGGKADNYDRLSLTMLGVVKRPKDDNEGLQPLDFFGYQILHSGDLVLKLIDLQNTSTSRISLSPYTGIVSPAYICITSKENMISAYAEKYFLSLWYRNIFNQLGDSGVRSSLNVGELMSIPIPVPSLEEQNRIASFLDTKCAEIDALTADIQKEIETLQEYRKSVITEAVTKGLDPNVEMKDSGIEWIGEIPTTWNVLRLKNLCLKITDGSHFSPLTTDDGVPYVTAKDIHGDGIVYDLTSKISEDMYYVLERNGCRPYQGDILLVKDGATTGRIGYMIDSSPCVLLSSVALLRTNNSCNSRYLMYFMMSKCMQEQIVMSMAGSAMPRTTLTKITEYVSTVPSIMEQTSIVSFLDTKCTEIDSIIADKQKQLEILAEYRKSLIYEYVTGKKEVPTA